MLQWWSFCVSRSTSCLFCPLKLLQPPALPGMLLLQWLAHQAIEVGELRILHHPASLYLGVLTTTSAGWEPHCFTSPAIWGMRHTSTALYFYGASKKSLHKPRATSENMLYHTSYGFNYYLQLFLMQQYRLFSNYSAFYKFIGLI